MLNDMTSGAATSLKYAKAHELPSFPSRGANANAAGAAALLAQDHKMKELWQPEQSAAGSKAAMLAAKDGGKLDLWQPSASSAGNSAATLAMRNKGLSPQVDRGYTDVGRNNSLLAATKVASRGRQRAGSLPMAPPRTYPDQQNSGKNALNAATVSHKQSTRDGWSSEANQAARVQNIHMNKEMFGDHPPVEPEVEEAKHKAALRASAVSMAKSMMDYQNRSSVASESDTSSLRMGSAGADYAHRRNQSSTSQADLKEEAMKYIHLQDAAHRLAQERLAKVEKDMENTRYREHYGYSGSGRQSRFSIRGRGRKRASSEGDNASDSDDEEQARRIRTQMSQLTTAQSTVEDKQKQEDRARLMAAAEKRVHARMHDMDEKVFQETGKPSQSMMDEWEAKAKERAEKERAEKAAHPGKTHIGGGKYMDQSEIEAIAAARLKPTLDELNDTAEKKRARDEQLRIEQDRRETARMQEKMDNEHSKAEFKRIRGECIAKFVRLRIANRYLDQDKAAAKREKEERKAAKRAEKEAEKAQKRKSREQTRDAAAATAGGAALATVVTQHREDEEKQEEEQKKDQAAAGSALADAVEKSKEEDEEAKKDQVAAGATLAEVAQRVRSNEDDEPKQSGVTDTDHDIVVAQPTVPVEETKEEPKEEPRRVSTEQSKSKRSSVFGSISKRFSRKEKDRKPGPFGEPKKSVEEDKTAIDDDADKHDDGAAAPAIGLQGAGLAAAAGIEEEHADSADEKEARGVDESTDKDEQSTSAAPATATGLTGGPGLFKDSESAKPVKEESDEEADKVKVAGAIAGTAALGAAVAAGAAAGDRNVQEQKEDRTSEVSSLSTEDELSDSDDEQERDLQGVTSAEHTGAYNFAMASPGVEKKPDLMRHISTIQDSSGSEPGSPDYSDNEEEEDRGRLDPRTTMAGEAERREDVPVRDTPIVIETVPASVPDEPDSPVSPLGTGHEEQPVLLKKEDAKQEEVGPEDSVSVAESGAPAPVVKGGPSQDESKKESKEKEKKEGGGVRGFFRKLKNKSKADNKLHKRQASAASSTSSLPATTAAVVEEKKGTDSEAPKLPEIDTATSRDNDDAFVTPVTTTAAGEQEQHMGIDGPIGDSKHVSGIDGNPRPESISSFKRGEAQPRDLDDVSSSGADEEEYSRGRAGRIARKLGLKKDKGKEKARDSTDEPQSAVTKGSDEDQFEEARDQFDESLAPPPAFGGQPKSESPVRETRFQEQL